MTTLNRGIVLKFMREALSTITEQEPRYSTLICATIERLVEARLHTMKQRDLNNEFLFLVNNRTTEKLGILLIEAYQQLLTLGYIIPAPKDTNAPNRNWFMVTDIGQEWATETEPIPEDAMGYISALKTIAPNVDPVILQYVSEALISYERKAFFASAVMIGAASEKTVYLLIDALHNSVQDINEKAAIQKVMERRTLPGMFTRISENIERAKTNNLMPYQVYEGADRHLPSIQEMIRVQRNDAVHPIVGQVTSQAVRLSLSAFPAACGKVYNLIDWLNNNQI